MRLGTCLRTLGVYTVFKVDPGDGHNQRDDGTFWGCFAGSACALMAIATLRLPETRGLELESEALGA